MLRRVNCALMLATLASAFALYAIKYDTRRLEPMARLLGLAPITSGQYLRLDTARPAEPPREPRRGTLARAYAFRAVWCAAGVWPDRRSARAPGAEGGGRNQVDAGRAAGAQLVAP